LLLTFTRRAAAEMLRRADSLMGQLHEILPSPHGRGTQRVPGGEGNNIDEEKTPPLTLTLSGHQLEVGRARGRGIKISRVWGGTFHRLGRLDQRRADRARPGKNRQAVP
jgi:superfamily I DNA/RNA helicase